jgi:hypothetical protein
MAMFDTVLDYLLVNHVYKDKPGYVLMQKDPRGEISTLAILWSRPDAEEAIERLSPMFKDHLFWINTATEIVR